MMQAGGGMELSVVIPVFNEHESIRLLLEEVGRAIDPGVHYEIIVVDDGSTDATAATLEKLAAEKAAGATVRKADYDDGATLETAFDGIETLFLISYASVEHHHRTEVRYQRRMLLQESY